MQTLPFWSWLVASLHFLALGIGLGSVFMRGRYIHAVMHRPKETENLNRLFWADNFWGIAAILWLVTGLLRAFGGLAKGTDYYLQSHLFWAKIALFGGVVLLELYPMITFVRWRLGQAKGKPLTGMQNLPLFYRINQLETVITGAIIFFAVGMARGTGL